MSPMLLERDGVLAELSAHLDETVRAHGRLVLLHGEAGVGKTSVLELFANSVESRVEVLRGWCDPLSTPRPLGPWLDVANGLGVTFPDGPDAPSAALQLVLQALSAGGDRVLVLEDLHWADEATLDLLRLLARRLQGRGVLLLTSYRDDEIGSRHPLRLLLGDLAGNPAVHRVAVEPLTYPGVAQLAADRGVDVEELYRVTGGNPFFVTEVLDSQVGGIPPTVGDAVAGRLARVSAEARRVAEVVAVIGSPAPARLLADLIGACEERLVELLGLGILQPQGDGVAFRHELARMAVLDAMPAFERSGWHAKVLQLLRADPADGCDNVLLTHHAQAAGDAGALLEYAPAAAAEAAASGAFREAAAHFAQALRFAGTLPPDRRAALLEGFAQASALAARIPEALDAFREAVELRARTGDGLREGETLRWFAWLSWPAGRCAEAREIGQRAVRVLEELPPSRELAWAYVMACQLNAYDGGDLAKTEEATRRAVALGERFVDPEAVAQARFHLLVSRYAAGGIEHSELEILRRHTHDAGLVDAAAYLATIEAGFTATHRDHQGTASAWNFLDELARERQIHRLLRAAGTSRARSLLHQGRWQDAVELGSKSADQPGELPLTRAVALVVLGLIRARRGDPDVWQPLDEADRIFEPTGWPRLIWAARAEAAWLTGDGARARREAKWGLATTTPQSDPWVVGELARWSMLTGGDPPAARVAEPFALELAGDWRGAAAEWERLDCPYDAALARLLGGDVSAVLAALSTFDSLGRGRWQTELARGYGSLVCAPGFGAPARRHAPTQTA